MRDVVHLRNANFRELAEQLQSYYSDYFRRVWVQYSNAMGRIRVCITMFPTDNGPYRMMFIENVRDFSFYNLVRHVKNRVNEIDRERSIDRHIIDVMDSISPDI
jgi:hypothetical protein